MKISKLSPVLALVTLGATCLVVRADDNPAQAAAREALAKAAFDMSGTNTTAQPPGTQVIPVDATLVTAPADATPATPAPAPTVPAEPAATPAPAAAAMATTTVNTTSEPAASTSTDTNVVMHPVATKEEAKADAKAKKEKAEKEKAEKAAMSTAPKTPPISSSDTNYVGQELGMKQIAAPALPISSSKQDQLKALLQKYEADQITPEQYHEQRAAILAQP